MCPFTLILILNITMFLFAVSLIGFTNLYRNVLKLLIMLELLALNFCILIVFIDYFHGWSNLNSMNFNGQLMILFILTVSALEASIGLALVYKLFKQSGRTTDDKLNQNKN